MDHKFLAKFLQTTQFSSSASDYFMKLSHKIEEEMNPLLSFYEQSYNYEATLPLVEELAHRCNESAYSIWMLLFILAAQKAQPLFATENHFWDTFSDLRYKTQECYDLHGIWGTFVPHWYPRFYKKSIVKLGRMEYELRTGALKEEYSLLGITLSPNDTTIHLHIPSSGEPFDKESRLESYRKAWEYFCPHGTPLVCVCSSWLLYDGYEDVFAPGSNIASFRKDFHMLYSKSTTDFGNAWRVFGKDHIFPAEQLPERTSLQRAFKAHYLKGGTHGNGTGVIVFDGEKLRSERQ